MSVRAAPFTFHLRGVPSSSTTVTADSPISIPVALAIFIP
jgi:hypothetical protein